MPIQVYAIDDGLYLNDWQGQVTQEHMRDAHRQLVQFNDDRRNRPFVLVNDVRGIEVSGSELKGFSEIVRTHYVQPLAVLVVGAPWALQIVSTVAVRILRVRLEVEFHKTLDDAYARGRMLLKETVR